MDNSPFFTVLIPTKNRSHLVFGAIESVLQQSFQKYEVIVIDNDDSEDTRKIVEQFTDPRVRYYRTGGLSMVENWEFGREKSSGEYLTVLEDKLTYYPWALECIFKIIQKSSTDVVVWEVGSHSTSAVSGPDAIDICEQIDADLIVEDYVHGRAIWKKLPRIINSCISSELVSEICAKNKTGQFFNYLSPDLVAAFSQLAIVDSIHYLPSILTYDRAKTSNASGVRVNKEKGIKYFTGKSDFDMKNAVDLVPIKNACLVHNTIYNDYLKTRKIFAGKLTDREMTEQVYVQVCLKDACSTLFKGGTIRREFRDIYAFMCKRFAFIKRVYLVLWWVKLISKKAMRVFIVLPIKNRLKKINIYQ